jgi:L-ascorbate metabolism protein UlaG (beta-lactamase superfamily)
VVVDWNESRRISDRLTLEVVPAQKMLGHKPNSYVLNASGLRVFVGTEARDIEPLRDYRKRRPAVDVALLPIDGSAIAGLKLVMRSSDAVEAANVLGAKILIPIHYAMKPVPILLQTPGSIADLSHLGGPPAELEIVPLETGRRWEWPNRVVCDRV